jgi:exonuclease SbcC
MKILRLTLRNLASLAGTHTVDFERDPLRSTGLFSISGPTGSGKSTLLDALCLALYEQTPRLAAASGTRLPDVGDEEITQRDPANLLRRGEAEGFAEVAFVGTDGRAYTARWSIRRAHQRRDGALQNTEMVLYRGNVPPGGAGPIECGGKKSEVQQAIAQKVGLTFAQFTRAVLLAQNDFAVFLKAEDKERAAILQALTGTERFERLSIAVFERDRQERLAIDAMQQRSEGQLPLSVEERAAADTALQTADARLREAKLKRTQREAQVAWFTRRKELQEAVEGARNAVGAATRARDAAAGRRDELELAEQVPRGARTLHDAEQRAIADQEKAARLRTETTASAEKAQRALAIARKQHADAAAASDKAQRVLAETTPALHRARALDAQLVPLVAQRADKRRERDAAERTRRELADRLEKIVAQITSQEKSFAALDEKRRAVAHVAPIAEEAAAWTERLTRASNAGQESERLRRETKAKASAETTLATHLEAAQKVAAERVATKARCEAARAAAEGNLKPFDPEALATERRMMEATHAGLTSLRSEAAKVADLSARLHTARSALARLNGESGTHAERLAAVEKTEFPHAQAVWTTTRDNLALAEAAVERATVTLRAKLRLHEACPVCGSLEHPYAAHPPAPDAALESIRGAEQQKRAALERLREEKTRLETLLSSLATQVQTKSSEVAALQHELGGARERVAGMLAACALPDAADDERDALIAAAMQRIEQERTALAEREARYRELARAYETAAKFHDKAQAEAVTAEKACSELVAAHAAAVSARGAAHEAAARAEQARNAAEAALDPLFAALPSGERERFDAGAVAFVEHFRSSCATFRHVTQELTTVGQRLASFAVEREEVTKTLTAANQNLRQREEACKQAEQAHTTGCDERRTLLGGRAADDAERELTAAVTQMQAALETAARLLSEAEKTAAAADAATKAAETTGAAAVRRRSEASAALEDWIARQIAETARPLDRRRVSELLGRTDEWFRTERAALAALADAVVKADGMAKAREQAVAEHEAARPTTDDEATVMAALQTRRMAEADAEANRASAAGVIAADDLRRKEHAQVLQALTELRRKAEPWARLSDLIGSADGAKFRTIVQGRTLDLLLGYANQQLELLSARYRLERLRPSLNLIVIDRDMADERRSVHSLSGGESFLISLALALGLASLTSNRIRIESLFIDEGFGSLDQATLNTAMNALMHLEAQGRKVGVISHVTEMADAIPVQIRVVKGHAGASRLIVPGVTADHQSITSNDEAAEATEAPASTGTRLLEVLQRHKQRGVEFVSSVALRKELGCEPAEFAAARAALGDRIKAQGRSLGLS